MMMKSLLQREPVAAIAAITALIQAGITLTIAFGLSLTTDQAAITTFVVAAGAFVQVLLVRQQVTPVADPKNSQGESLVPVQGSPPAPAGDGFRSILPPKTA
jgi:hypothetical protein